MVEVKFSVKPPVEATEEQIREWIYFELGYHAQMSTDNPLHEYDLDAEDVSIF